ncbi:MAG: hypothetical protein KAY32_02715 [Candidatus Eisenbacteria sp.]|nr:hypothetical protein [Candidatus Eisenbacteria bacterium]
MSRLLARFGWRPAPATLVATGVVILGFVLCNISWGYLWVVALGTFGPGLLRELGLLRDKDEFERRAAHRAGYHAYLVGGLVTFLLLAHFRANEHPIQEPSSLVTAIFIVFWFTWLLSSLLSYWGPRKTASRLLVVFGSVWLLFVILSNTGPEWRGPMGIIMHSLLAIPFFALAYAARRWPRIAGVLLLGISGFFFYFFGLFEIVGENPLEKGRPVVIVLFVGPLVASGLALLRVGSQEE